MPGLLDMTLDDVIQRSGSGKGSQKGGKKGWKGHREDSADGGWPRDGGKSKGKGVRSKDTKLDMSLDDVIWADGDSGYGSKGKGKGKSKSKGEGKGFAWSSKGSKGRGKYDEWSYESGNGSFPQWMEHDDWRSDAERSWEGSGRMSAMKSDWDDDRRGGRLGGNGGERGNSPGWRRVEQPDRNGRASDRGSGMRSTDGDKARPKRGRGEDSSSNKNVKRIKVTNIPRDLAARDIREAFEAEAGKMTSCELDRGVAYLTFTCTADARKAVETFDRGELNGKTITVTLEP